MRALKKKVQVPLYKFFCLIAAMLVVAVFAEAWNAWWHVAVGKQDLLTAPHLLLAVSVLIAVASSFYIWLRRESAEGRGIFFLLLFVPLAAFLDHAWQGSFGSVGFLHPLTIWSPPHLLVVFGLAGALIMTLKELSHLKDRDTARLFMMLGFGALLWLGYFLLLPLSPMGPDHLLGFWGAGFHAFLLIGVLMVAERLIKGTAEIVPVALVFLVLLIAGVADHMGAAGAIPEFVFGPHWLTIFAYVVAASLLEIGTYMPPSFRGAIAAFFWALLLYGFTPNFVAPEFGYSATSFLIAIVASIIGGLFAGAIAKAVVKEER